MSVPGIHLTRPRAYTRRRLVRQNEALPRRQLLHPNKAPTPPRSGERAYTRRLVRQNEALPRRQLPHPNNAPAPRALASAPTASHPKAPPLRPLT